MSRKGSAKAATRSSARMRATRHSENSGIIVSMTGYGRATMKSKNVEVTAEIKSINNRFLDLSLKLPRCYTQFEHELRSFISDRLKRGRVELYIERSPLTAAAVELNFNRGVFDSYYKLARSVCEEYAKLDSESNSRLVLDLLRQREVLSIAEEVADEEAERKVLFSTVEVALIKLSKMREIEGAKLGNQLKSELEELGSIQEKIAKRSKNAPAEHIQRIKGRLKELSPDVLSDESRLYMEAALLAEKADISEELTRLGSHLKQFEQVIKEGSHGRKLDFLAQEIIREVNTIGSKAQSSEVRSLVVSAKVTIDKIREQVQNIE